MDWRKTAKSVAKGLGIGYAVVFVLATVFQRQMIYQTWSIDFEEATQRPWLQGLTQVAITTNDGEMLKAYWKKPAPGAPVIISFHGNAAVPQHYADRFAASPWADSGYGVLAVAYRGYPGSTGTPSEAGLLEDGRAAYDYARKLAPTSRVIVHGHSLGSGVAVAMAAERRVLALILDAPYTSILEVASDRYPFLPSFILFDTFRSDERIKDAHAERIFITHGTSDAVIGFGYGKRLASMRPDITFYPIPGGDHFDIMGKRDIDMEREITALYRSKKPKA